MSRRNFIVLIFNSELFEEELSAVWIITSTENIWGSDAGLSAGLADVGGGTTQSARHYRFLHTHIEEGFLCARLTRGFESLASTGYYRDARKHAKMRVAKLRIKAT
jgi:hypothetical protein